MVCTIVSVDSYVSTSYFAVCLSFFGKQSTQLRRSELYLSLIKKSLLLNFKKLEGNNIFETLYIVDKWLRIIASEELLFP